MKTMQSYKKYTAKEIIKNLENDNRENILNKFKENKPDFKKTSIHQVWQEGYHPKKIYSIEMLRHKIEYIHYNPVKRKLVDKPEDWEYSSAGDYFTDVKGKLNIERII